MQETQSQNFNAAGTVNSGTGSRVPVQSNAG